MKSVKQKKKWLRMMFAAAAAVSLLLSAACSSNNKDEQAADKSSLAMNESEAVSDHFEAKDERVTGTAATATEAPADGESADMGIPGGAEPDADGFSRKLIYHANVTMEVSDYGQAQTELNNIIHLSGGYVLQFGDQKSANELGGTYTIKVPAAGFQSFLSQLEKLKHMDYESSMKGTDVTEEYVDLESRLKARQVVEARLLGFMDKATRADDLLKYSEQLGTVQLEIERLKGRMRYLDQNVDFSTIELRMYQTAGLVNTAIQPKEAVWERSLQAMKASSSFLVHFVQSVLVVAAGALPVAIVILLVGLPLYYLYRRKRHRALELQAAGGSKLSIPDKEE
ncbi:DUF4349 domain-containing protein [Paenibacillus nasutitermitis]|uniref:DUF4349 domain-containing protein n=1 Tax=Paenibacillus nasutitermitis TaxID=1652958 RepID=A0A917DVE3_9BACL|nr:DUF4349 domain-containing protein [Paenibacillus nasutitermitis]GGD71106.1 hypothetical protein GCM10010911_31220 [Paenibacillus nasutitermitis]